MGECKRERKEGRKESREGRGKKGRKKERRDNDQVINEKGDITTDQKIKKKFFNVMVSISMYLEIHILIHLQA